jgi:hypothetical protein
VHVPVVDGVKEADYFFFSSVFGYLVRGMLLKSHKNTGRDAGYQKNE